MGRVFIFCFYFHQFKNITQTSSILLFWQTNNTIEFARNCKSWFFSRSLSLPKWKLQGFSHKFQFESIFQIAQQSLKPSRKETRCPFLLIWIFQQTPRTSLVFRSKLTKRLLVSPTSFMSVKSPTNILLHNSATVNVLSTGRIVHGTICLERNCTLKLTRTVFSLVA